MSTVNTFSHDATQSSVASMSRSSVFSAALICLGVAYALSWVEMALAMMTSPAGNTAALITSHVLMGGLYLCVALRLQWARWLTVALGVGAVLLVGPMVGPEWRAFPLAAVVTGAMLVCKLAASLFLLSPVSSRAARAA